MSGLRIGVDINPLSPPYTGIGNYQLWLLDALIDLAPEIDLAGFGRLEWKTVDRTFMDQRIAAAGKGNVPGATPQPARRSRGDAIARLVRASKVAHGAAASVRAGVFRSSVRARRLDAYHAFMYRAPAKRPGLPVIPVVYDLSHLRHPETHPAQRLRWMAPVADACRDAPVIHTISEFSAREIATAFDVSPERIVVVPPAVGEVFRNENAADPAVLARLGVTAGRYALAVSTLEPRKNLSTLLAAYGRLSPQHRRRMPLVLAGASGWGETRIEAHPLVASGDVVISGYVSDAELAALYRGARAMFYPSLYEGYGMPVIEALACGTEVVASDAASMPEALGGGGTLVAPLDIDGWTAALERAAEAEPAADARQREARAEAACAWTWRDAAARVQGLYARLGQ